MDTVGSIFDKLATINQKMFLNQDLIYKIRRMSFEEYKKEFFETEDGAMQLWTLLKKSTDLNVQRQALIQETDEKLVELIKAVVNGEDINNGKFIQDQHKTY